MKIDEILQSNDLGLMKRHLRRLYDNYEIATKTQLDGVTEKIELLKQTEQLKNEIEKLKESFAVVNGISNTLQFELESNKEFYESQLSEKDKELSELKAKHEKDVKKAWQKGSESWIRGAQTAEQYYTQTHGQ